MIERAYNATRGCVLAERSLKAAAIGQRLKGLLGRASLPRGEALRIAPCNSIHTFFMRFPIDVLFLDGGGTVLRAIPRIPPWRATRVYPAAREVLELPAGVIEETGTAPGDRIEYGSAR